MPSLHHVAKSQTSRIDRFICVRIARVIYFPFFNGSLAFALMSQMQPSSIVKKLNFVQSGSLSRTCESNIVPRLPIIFMVIVHLAKNNLQLTRHERKQEQVCDPGKVHRDSTVPTGVVLRHPYLVNPGTLTMNLKAACLS